MTRFLSLIAAACFALPAAAEDAERIVGLGGSVTEIIYALGAGDRLVARDSTSTYPAEVEDLPKVGYIRNLSPEGVLSVSPDLIIAEDDAGPPEAVDLLQSAQIPFVLIPDVHSADGVADKIRAVGTALGLEDEAQKLAADVHTKITGAAELANQAAVEPKRVLFILSLRGGRVFAGGNETSADAMIRLAGGVNAIADVNGWKPLSDEAISRAAPDVILMMDRGGDHGATNADLFALPSLAITPAAETNSVIRMNGLYLTGFGPRTADAIADLSRQLYDN